MTQTPAGGETPRSPLAPPPYPSGQAAGPAFAITEKVKSAGVPTLLSAVAIILAIVALLRGCSDASGLGKGLSSYDFSTPEAAAKSIIQIESNADIRAQIELERMKRGDAKDAARTLEVNRVVDYGDLKLVFVSYMANGKKQKTIKAFEKDLESKQWVPRSVNAYQVKQINEPLARDMAAWEASSTASE